VSGGSTVPRATLDPMTDVPPSPAAGAPAFSADDLARHTGGTILARSSRPIRGGAVDSRLVRPGVMFVALPGERSDGHLHLAAAAAAGAAALVVTRPPQDPHAFGDVTVLRVGDGLHALDAAASAWRSRFDPLVVGVTGSIAKTSTKEAVAAVLAARFRTLRSEGNQNNEIGLPLTVLDLGPEHDAAVLEMGMYVGGEIADLARIARPSIGVVTAVQGVHLSRIGTLDAIEAAKAELVEALPADGTAVLNADDPRVVRMAARTAARVVTYGFDERTDVTAADVVSDGFAGMRFELRTAGLRRPVSIPGLGRLAVHNALAAVAVGLAAGLDIEGIVTGLRAPSTAAHRGEALRGSGVAIVDDTYNASPGSMRAALELLAGLPGRRIAVLGEMLELGDAHDAGHREVGAAAATTVDLLITVGPGAAGIAEGALEAGLASHRVLRAADAEDALDLLQRRLHEGDVVLVKASRGAALEGLVAALAAELAAEPVAPVDDGTLGR
jgi:UDP-N-acetylmuramoyl-tripeptide--D-alanyl-D-alanine ligase